MTEYNIRLNPNCAAAVHTGLKFKAGDKGIEFKIAVDELDTTGTAAKIVFQRANGTSVESDITGTDGVYTYKTLGNEFAVPGKTVADVKFYAADARVSTASFVFEVSGDTMDGLGAGAGGYSDRLEQLATEAEDAMKNAENVSKELENLLTVYQNKFGEVGVLNPKGTYNSATIYEAFDLVYYGGVSWLCLQRCTGVTPAEGAYWQLFASADGGNAEKLGGKLPSEFAPSGYGLGATLGKVLSNAFNLNDIKEGGWYHWTSSVPTNAPSGYCVMRVDVGDLWCVQHVYSVSEQCEYVRVFDNPEWTEWKTIATTADLANYLPKSGGKLSGYGDVLSLESTGLDVWMYFYGANSRNGSVGYYNGLANVANEISGGRIGVDNNGVAQYWTNPQGDAKYNLLHTGNKPSGTYTGTGANRTISTGNGVLGATYIIRAKGSENFALVTSSGNICKQGSSIVAIDGAYSTTNSLVLNTNSAMFNANGTVYEYFAL